MSGRTDLLLEIGMEEMPARFVRGAMEQLKDKVTAWLVAQRIGYGTVQALATPRRLALVICDVELHQAAKSDWIKGPALKSAKTADGGYSNAALGFARSQGVSPDQFEVRSLGSIEYLYVLKEDAGRETATLLEETLPGLISGLTFPKNMRWSTHELRYLRPIRWIVALFGEAIIPFQITNVTSGNTTFGHRFLGGELQIVSPRTYADALREQYVIADPTERKALIETQLKQMESEHGWHIPVDEDLLEEVLFLVEYPTALCGNFEEAFLKIPKEVLMTSMREHQRYFPVLDAAGNLLPHFVTVRNGNATSIQVVAKGNEKVLRARLSDAKFFYEEDHKKTIDACLAKLESIIQQEQLGTMGDKVRRVEMSSAKLVALTDSDETTRLNLARAAAICKFDLVTAMVYEFTELQGLMGEHYAELKGENTVVSHAIREQYMPKGAGDALPSSRVGLLLSMADKADNILGCFYLNMIPTGSQDPYALRRQAAGIVQMLAEADVQLLLSDVFEAAWNGFKEAKVSRELKLDDAAYARCKKEWDTFIGLRLKNMLESRGVRYDVVDALLSRPVDDVKWLVARADELMQQLANDEAGLKKSVEAWLRVCNLASKAEDVLDISQIAWQTDAERTLSDAIVNAKDRFMNAVQGCDARSSLQVLSAWVEPISIFFEHTMVMVDDAELRKERLSLLHAGASIIWKFADFSKLVWSSGV